MTEVYFQKKNNNNISIFIYEAQTVIIAETQKDVVLSLQSRTMSCREVMSGKILTGDIMIKHQTPEQALEILKAHNGEN